MWNEYEPAARPEEERKKKFVPKVSNKTYQLQFGFLLLFAFFFVVLDIKCITDNEDIDLFLTSFIIIT
jgi:hypothetical protein